MAYAYPLFLDIRQRLIVIIGGGAVAVRKARGALAAGAQRVRCVSPEVDAQMPEEVERTVQHYHAGHLDGADLVFAATNRPDVNDAVVRDCRARKILVNRADADDLTPADFVTPALLRQDALIVAVSAGSAALSTAIRSHLLEVIDTRYVQMATAMKSLRTVIRDAGGLDAAKRAAVFRELATDEALAVLDEGGIERLCLWIAKKFPEISHA